MPRKEEVLYETATVEIPFSQSTRDRAVAIMEESSIRSFDALHIAYAEAGGVDYLLTTDDRLEKACAGIDSTVKIANPLRYITEVITDE